MKREELPGNPSFCAGNILGRTGGRPKGAKNTLPIIRDKLFRILLRRITSDKDLEAVDTATLIKFASACLPKDMSLAITKDPVINYISNVPRPELPNNDLQQLPDYAVDVTIPQVTQVVDVHVDSTT